MFTAEDGAFAGLSHRDADPQIVEEMRRRGTLICAGHYQHQYPQCWRCDSPVIFRATKQWFVDLTAFTTQALAEVERFVDRAGYQGFQQVVVIHGLGTGALKAAVTAHLQGHALVASLRPGEPAEGGAGVTVVELKR